jgi:Domain of unknown function (DUF4124)
MCATQQTQEVPPAKLAHDQVLPNWPDTTLAVAGCALCHAMWLRVAVEPMRIAATWLIPEVKHAVWLTGIWLGIGLALVYFAAAQAATVYRWVDSQGKTHFGDTVPSAYKGVAQPITNKVTAPSPEQQRLAQERAAEQKAKARAAGLPQGTESAASAATPAASAPKPVLKRPPQAPTEDTACSTWQLLYQESLDCFGPYRTTRGATKAEAFDHCTPVPAPPQRCGRSAP